MFTKVCRAPFAVSTTDAAKAGIEVFLNNEEGASPRDYAKALFQYCENNSNDLIILVFRSLILETNDNKSAFPGLVVLIDTVPSLDITLRVEAQMVAFMSNLAKYTVRKHKSPRGNEKFCIGIYQAFNMIRQQHLNCKRCCPTKKSRKEARNKLFDQSTATALTDWNCGREGRFHKIVGIDVFWPDCLPSGRSDNLEWLEDPAERMKVMTEIVGEPSFKDDKFGVVPKCPSGVQTLDDLLGFVASGDRHHPLYDKLVGIVGGLTSNEFIAFIYYGIKPDRYTGFLWYKGLFQVPNVIYDKVSLCMIINFKKCGFCDKVEEVTFSFPWCSRCKNAWYCCRDHQLKHWKTHKKDCVLKVDET